MSFENLPEHRKARQQAPLNFFREFLRSVWMDNTEEEAEEQWRQKVSFFADYAEDIWDRPPCDPGGAKHERHFGLVRPDGSLKPHADAVRRFAATNPQVQAPTKMVDLDVSPDEYYRDPRRNAERCYLGF